ncbi:ESX secretion-associated protein EspG [Mycolicibacterium arenosum]|uniref:ESX secretion-associated protein EspG n=1 Tax=Mycolicibacterium arenosum TaxID=2952157 RepID=A0ABT1LXD6_9MYCO|nr:ESX secretion-associated protein EspG [Mycolicibacterium sp. CAU 1645]MCP9271546.1 ESX secretion-associated protein EspG [Mycolicibacterium sp. CAU 1645]
MSATADLEYALSDTEVRAIADAAGVQSLPTVLTVAPRPGSTPSSSAALDATAARLSARGLIAGGLVNDDLCDVLMTLQRPDRELAMRLVTPDGIARLSVVRRGGRGVMARRVGDRYLLRPLSEAGLRSATRVILGELPAAEAAAIDAVGAPLDVMAESLGDTHDGRLIADRLCALGAESRAAMLIGSALAARRAFAEIVYFALAAERDRVERGPAAVAVLYTKRGRILASPSASPSGQFWTTLKPGTDHAIAAAVGQLVGLSDEGWEGP